MFVLLRQLALAQVDELPLGLELAQTAVHEPLDVRALVLFVVLQPVSNQWKQVSRRTNIPGKQSENNQSLSHCKRRSLVVFFSVDSSVYLQVELVREGILYRNFSLYNTLLKKLLDFRL